MRHVIVPAVAVVLVASNWLAQAAYSEHGTVKSLDMQAMTLTLTNGRVFDLLAGWSNPDVRPQDVVTITYDVQGGEGTLTIPLASSIVINGNYEDGLDE